MLVCPIKGECVLKHIHSLNILINIYAAFLSTSNTVFIYNPNIMQDSVIIPILQRLGGGEAEREWLAKQQHLNNTLPDL